MDRRSRIAAGALVWAALAACVQVAAGQGVEAYAFEDAGGEFGLGMAAVISNIWVGAFALTSIVFAVLGLAVAFQWPNPRCCCYRTRFSDLPNTGGAGRACCSLFTLNVGFLIAWMLMLAIMAVSRDVIRIAVCLGFVMLHGLAVGVFRWQFKRKGRPEYADAETGGGIGMAAMGRPLYHIPMTTATVGGEPVPGTWGTYPPPQQQQQPPAPPAGGAGAACAPAGAPPGAGGVAYPPAQQAMPPIYSFGGPSPYPPLFAAPAAQQPAAAAPYPGGLPASPYPQAPWQQQTAPAPAPPPQQQQQPQQPPQQQQPQQQTQPAAAVVPTIPPPPLASGDAADAPLASGRAPSGALPGAAPAGGEARR
ncbi:hypothetical protein Rsub_04302 [Raphidocelis subcapitata]|uniref:Uncharacterized protein n=1 Tax=Raphidocelis subcapitata TaxID=307507 RepID=A0A2V0NY03_9CHLO|nr:hypothetical protein Rsub_04302 [Raphidocelis subcapitata]|eukprot:GBF91562.1 hypothetical protein Rsub_04302 [Raphidocelis subcapitata]